MNSMVKILFWFSGFVILYSYLLYPIILWVLDQKKTSYISIDSEQTPYVSLIVTAYNEEKVIRNRIQNLLQLHYPKNKLEIIIASDGSTDSTDKIVCEYISDTIKLIRYEPRSGKINVLNKVILQAKGDIIVLSDANTIYHIDAVHEIVRKFYHPEIGCVCGKLMLKPPQFSNGGELEGVYWHYENFIKHAEGNRGALPGANGGIYAFRKQLFKILPSNTICDDLMIPMNILMQGYKVVYDINAIAYEETCKDISDEQERKIRIGAGAYQAMLLTFSMFNILKGFPSLAYLSHKIMRWMVPFLIIVMLITNLILFHEPLYLYICVIQACLYISAYLGYLLNKKVGLFKVFHLSYYFISMNFCLLLGFWRFITKTQDVTWHKVER